MKKANLELLASWPGALLTKLGEDVGGWPVYGLTRQAQELGLAFAETEAKLGPGTFNVRVHLHFRSVADGPRGCGEGRNFTRSHGSYGPIFGCVRRQALCLSA